MLAKEQRFIERFSTHAAKAAQVQSRVKALDKIERIELPKKRQAVKFDFLTPPRSGDQVAVISGVNPGQEVVTSGVFKLRNGAAVFINNKVKPSNSAAPKPEDS
jgi:ATPase subunit of ABC transporter with duplicated ATPase domains